MVVRRVRQRWAFKRARQWIPFRIRLWAAGLRSVACRHRLVSRGLRVVVLLVVAGSVVSSIDAARAAADRWGERRPVVVAVADRALGTSIEAAAFELEERPVAHVPPDALRSVPTGDHLVVSVRVGDVVTERHLRSMRGSELDRPRGTRIVAFPVDPHTPSIAPGDLVDLIVVGDPYGADAGTHRVVGEPAIVIAVVEDSVSLAVDDAVVGDVVAARAGGRVSLAVRAG